MEQLPYELRPHHGMCIAFFAGRGYSSAFTAHMAAVIRQLRENPPVRLSVRTDVICAKCPHNRAGCCDAGEKTEAYDRMVLSLCGLREGTVLPYEDFRRAVYETILLPDRRETVCGDCQWSPICHCPPKP